MVAQARKRYGRGLDLAILPETAVTGEAGEDALVRSVPLAGPLQEVFSAKAREHNCYIVVPTYLLDSPEKELTCPTGGGRGASLIDWAAIGMKGSLYGRQGCTTETLQ
jgi:predicted amidohydrolase